MAIGETTASLIGYLGKATQWGRELWAPGEQGNIPVAIQDQHTKALDLKFIQQDAVTSNTVEVLPGARQITVADPTGFVDGKTIGLFDSSGSFYFGEQVGVAVGGVITLDTPVDRYVRPDQIVLLADHHLNVEGSTTTQIFKIGPVGVGSGVAIDITRIMGYIQDATAMDDALFGGIAALTNGVVLRVNNSVINNIWNMKSNGEFGLLSYDTMYSTKAPAGSFGFRFRNTYAGQSKHGVTLRLDPGDTLEILIQDDLTDLEDFQIMAQGHVVTY